jgi:hypothetical protein
MSQLQDTLGKRASRVPAGPVTPPASSRRD